MRVPKTVILMAVILCSGMTGTKLLMSSTSLPNVEDKNCSKAALLILKCFCRKISQIDSLSCLLDTRRNHGVLRFFFPEYQCTSVCLEISVCNGNVLELSDPEMFCFI